MEVRIRVWGMGVPGATLDWESAVTGTVIMTPWRDRVGWDGLGKVRVRRGKVTAWLEGSFG